MTGDKETIALKMCGLLTGKIHCNLSDNESLHEILLCAHQTLHPVSIKRTFITRSLI